MAAAAHPLIDLAHARSRGDRDRLLLGVVDLCAGAEDARRPELRDLLGDVFVTLSLQAERSIRKALAERLASAEWAPKALIDLLALDEIEIARPVILASPLLEDADLLHILVQAAIEHQIEVAQRPGIGAIVVDAILDKGEPSVITALAGNTQAEVSEDGMLRLVAASRRILSLRAPMARHPRLTKPLALKLYVWVGEALRTALTDRFPMAPAELALALGQAVSSAHAGEPARVPPSASAVDELLAVEKRLVAKLEAAGELRAGFLLRALKERRLERFQTALAALGDFEVAHVRRACSAPDPELLALACAAVGIDRVVFPSLLVDVRDLNGGRPAGGPESARRTAAAFERGPPAAAKVFRDLVVGV
jgi:uncharacterized protein (DUF2336 family)